MSKILAILCLFVLLGAFSIGWEKRKKHQALECAFANRERLSPEAFHRRYFSDIPKPIVLGVREILEQQLDADLDRLQDKDDFSKNLSFFWDFDSMADVEIVIALEKRFGIHIEDAEAENTVTVRDILSLVHRKLLVTAPR